MMKINPILREMIKYFSHLYGKRNSIYFPGLIDRIASLGIAIGDLQDIIRKDYSNNKKIGMALARIVGRIFCVADNFKTLNLSLAMVVKYPKDHCVYCNNYPCNCPENRPQPQFSYDTVKIQNIWTLENWQRHLMSVYGERNRKKGIENLLNRLSREVHELSSLRATIPGLNMSLDDIEMKFASELADTLAWTIGIANFFRIDLQDEIYKRYKNGCWKCHSYPCECRGISFEQIDWNKVEIE